MRFNVVSLLAVGLATLAAAAPQENPTEGFNPISKPDADSHVVKGEFFTIKWAPRNKDKKDDAKIFLYGGKDSKSLNEISHIATVKNTGSYRWKPRKSRDTSLVYGIRIENANKKSEFQWSESFHIFDPKKSRRTDVEVTDSSSDYNGEKTHEHSESSGDSEGSYSSGGEEGTSYESGSGDEGESYGGGSPPPCPSSSTMEPCHECPPATTSVYFSPPPPPPTSYAPPQTVSSTPPPYPTQTSSGYVPPPPASTGYVPSTSAYQPGPSGSEPAASASATPTGAANKATYNLGAAGIVGGAIAALVI